MDAHAHGTQPYAHIPFQTLHALSPGAPCGYDYITFARNTLQKTGNKDGLQKFCTGTQLKPAEFDSTELLVWIREIKGR